jgi:hypothetical protein
MGRATAGALGLAVAMTAAVSPAAWAADWIVAPTLTLGIDNDTNRLLTSPAIPSRGLLMSLDTNFEHDTERLQLKLRPYGEVERYTDHRLDPTSEEGIDATGTWLATERSSLTLHTMVQDASTVYSDLSTTGLIHVGQRRRDEDFDGTWAFQQTERWTLQLESSYNGTDYYGAGTSALSNYRQSLGTATESFAYTEQVTLSLNASAGDAHTTGAEQSTRIDSVGTGLQWRPTERASVQGSVGISRQTTAGLTTNTTVGELSVTYSNELGNVALTAQRMLQPSGLGIFSQVDQATLTAGRNLTERLTLDAEAQVYRTTSAFTSPFISFTYADRTYAESHLRLNWQQTPTVTLALQLQYQRADDPVSYLYPTGLQAHGWAVSLQSVWAPLGANVSR